MKALDQHCDFPVLEKILEENSLNEAMEHLTHCDICLEQLYSFDSNMYLINRQDRQNEKADLDENKLAQLMDKMLENQMSKNGFAKEPANELAGNTFSMHTLIRLLSVITQHNKADLQNTPAYLKNLVMAKLDEKTVTPLNKLIIKISDGLNVMGSYIENLFIIPESPEMIPVRSGNNNGNSQGTLNFYLTGDDKEKINYHVVKDSNQSVMLTIKLENFKQSPGFIYLRQDQQLISSQPLKDNYVYFPRIQSGEYNLEIKFTSDKAPIVMPLAII